ncbi:MAG: wax ester/triacylglycerol synthase family O-acyltransferase [Polyangiales bacterium]|nr:wax ester/triacylglycerol synthase family O-acyltransferase [Myxococcales bacterium]MCB9660774.1 wax ester/triacylglycerol synthase family O-acyltransferase [Sandaracinaceae bacterium]
MERLSGLDASFLYLETPKMHMHVAMAAVLDPANMPGGYSFEKVQNLIESRVHRLPAFRRRLVEVPFELHHPVWIDDPDFDIIRHVRRVACPAPGGRRELGEICGRIASTPLDRSRPLWEAWVIEGIEGGRFAVMTKVHHAAVDGATGAGLLVHLFSLDASEAAPGPATTPTFRGEGVPSPVDMLREAVVSRVKQPAEFVRLVAQTASAVAGVAKQRQEADALVGGTPLRAPRTSFNGALSARRNVAFAQLPLEGLKRVKDRHGVKLNDVVLAVCAGTLRRYLEGRAELPVDPLVAVCPISVRSMRPGLGSNHVSGMFTSLATDIDDPVERLMAIKAATMGAKHEHQAIGADMLQSWAEFAAPTTFHLAGRFYSRLRLADKHRPIHNLVISNVPGPQVPIYLAGARLVAVYPMGPVMEGAGLNITVMSYDGHVDFGFMVAADLVPDVWSMAAFVRPAYEELRTAR